MTSARESLSSMSLIRASTSPCRSLAAWYSAFSLRSPCSRAMPISREILGRSSLRRDELFSKLLRASRSHGHLVGHGRHSQLVSQPWFTPQDRDPKSAFSAAPRHGPCPPLPQACLRPSPPAASASFRKMLKRSATFARPARGRRSSQRLRRRRVSTPKARIEYAENAKREYEKGVRRSRSENWEGATEVFNELRRKYSYSRLRAPRRAPARRTATTPQEKVAGGDLGVQGVRTRLPERSGDALRELSRGRRRSTTR
jgi:hypothetical protein